MHSEDPFRILGAIVRYYTEVCISNVKPANMPCDKHEVRTRQPEPPSGEYERLL